MSLRERLATPGRLARWAHWALIAILAYLVLLPLVRLQLLAFEDGGRGYRAQFDRPDVTETVLTTLGLGLGSLVISLVLGTYLAYAVSRLPARWRFLSVVPVLPIVLPSVANVVGWAFLFSPGPGYLNAALRQLPWWSHLERGPVDIYTTPWIILITGLGLTSFVYLFVSAGLQGINSEHLEAAQVAGSSQVGVFFRIILPLLRPSLLYGAGVSFLLALGQFTGPLLLGANTGVKVLTTEMYRRVSESPVDFGAAAAAGSPLVVLGLLIIYAQRRALGDQRRFVTHSGKSFSGLTTTSPGAVVGILLFGGVSLLLPLAALVLVSVSPYWTGSPTWDSLTLDHFRTLFSMSSAVSAIWTSVVASLVAVCFAVPLGLVGANLLVRRRDLKWVRGMADFLITLPLGIPAVIFGVGFLLTYTRPPIILYGTTTVVILVYVVLMLPFATRMFMTALISLGEGYVEASSTSGATPFQTAVHVLVPMLRPTVLSAVALMFILLTHEFAASLLVRAGTTQVMGTVLFDLWLNGSYPLVAAMALVMTVVTGLGVGLAMVLGGRDVLNKL